MRITERHLSDAAINTLIHLYENLPNDNVNIATTKALLELKQLRAEDRQREANQCNGS